MTSQIHCIVKDPQHVDHRSLTVASSPKQNEVTTAAAPSCNVEYADFLADVVTSRRAGLFRALRQQLQANQ